MNTYLLNYAHEALKPRSYGFQGSVRKIKRMTWENVSPNEKNNNNNNAAYIGQGKFFFDVSKVVLAQCTFP